MIRPWEAVPEPGAALEVAPGILWARLPLPMKLDHVNVYALEDAGGWALVDTGLNWAKGAAALDALLAGPLAGRPVTRVLLTHHHPDHVGQAARFVAEEAELLTSRTAWLYARMLTLDERARPGPEELAFLRAAGMPDALLAERAGSRPFNFADCVQPLPPGFTRLVEGQALALGGRAWTVRMGDGHAPEHVTLWSEDVVIGGDQLLPGISPNLGVDATEPEADPVGDWLAACRRLQPFAADQLVLPGHKTPYTGLPERLAQMIDNHVSALDRLHAALATPMNAVETFATLYQRDIGAGEFGLALVEAVGHLNRLGREGRAQRDRRDGVDFWRAS